MVDQTSELVRLRFRFWFPKATKVKVVIDGESAVLQTSDGQRWETTVLRSWGSIITYRFVVDDIWSFPDPHNAAYTLRDGLYLSVLDTDAGPVDCFPEEPEALFVPTRYPALLTHGRSVRMDPKTRPFTLCWAFKLL